MTTPVEPTDEPPTLATMIRAAMPEHDMAPHEMGAVINAIFTWMIREHNIDIFEFRG